MPTNKEKYGHEKMNDDELEDRISADMFELYERFRRDPKTATIGSLIWRLMHQLRESYRTAKLIENATE